MARIDYLGLEGNCISIKTTRQLQKVLQRESLNNIQMLVKVGLDDVVV